MKVLPDSKPGHPTGQTDPESVPLLDVPRGNDPLSEKILSAIAAVCESGRFVFGPDCRKLEESVAALSGAKHGIGCASGSDALLLSLMAYEVGPGDEVLVPSFTFFATASAIARLGARPVWVDIDPATYNLDPAALEEAITPAAKAVIPVHLFGQCAEMDPICEIARRHKLAVIEDAAQSIGASYRGRPAGSLGDVGCYSFYPTKNLGGFGDGGMLVTSNDDLAERLRLLRGHGMAPRYYHQIIGVNSRLDSIQAAVLNVKLPQLPRWTSMRQRNAARYAELLARTGLNGALGVPVAMPYCGHVWNQFTIRIPNGRRDALRKHLADHRIGTEIYYPIALHQQECFRSLGLGDVQLPETERASEEVLHLPIFPELTEAEQRLVVRRIAEFFVEQAARDDRSTKLAASGTPAPERRSA